ncbi:hypothetical protein [Aureimonas sp. Leaf460]|uniref:hypothetical protein n=1 Tax=Aureimonas sp. Leaf460 TaxID=1736384 RepID=UPI001FCD184C|nr:hypothetical protein [Aureimonas sp. Leaf460]
MLDQAGCRSAPKLLEGHEGQGRQKGCKDRLGQSRRLPPETPMQAGQERLHGTERDEPAEEAKPLAVLPDHSDEDQTKHQRDDERQRDRWHAADISRLAVPHPSGMAELGCPNVGFRVDVAKNRTPRYSPIFRAGRRSAFFLAAVP